VRSKKILTDSTWAIYAKPVTGPGPGAVPVDPAPLHSASCLINFKRDGWICTCGAAAKRGDEC
jgi:hypothetical protein